MPAFEQGGNNITLQEVHYCQSVIRADENTFSHQ